MTFRILALIISTCFSVACLSANPIDSSKDGITVYVFLHESCLISQYYTLPLRKLHQEYCNKNIQFVGLFPNLSSKTDKIRSFKKKYKIPFELKTDFYHTKTDKFGATITPEVVVYNETKQQIIYKGRIDDSYARVGKRKRVTATSDLKNVLEAIVNDKSILVFETKAVGCFISKNKLTN